VKRWEEYTGQKAVKLVALEADPGELALVAAD